MSINWKYKQFEREIIFHESPGDVAKATRAAFTESLHDWKFTETADGFEASGTAFAHSEIARFRFLPAEAGTKVSVTLFVQRAGPMGFMLVDIGGAYNEQISKWLENIQRHLHPENNPVPPAGSAPPKMTAATKFTVGCVGCFGIFILLFLLIQTIYAVIALFTGSLYLLLAGNSHDITIHGIWARIGAVIILAFDALLVFLIFRNKRARPKIHS